MKNSVVQYDICYFRKSQQAAHSGSHAKFTCAWVETTEQSTVTGRGINPMPHIIPVTYSAEKCEMNIMTCISILTLSYTFMHILVYINSCLMQGCSN